MPWSIIRDKGAITKYGGGVIKILEVDDSGTPISGARVIDLGYIQETVFSDQTEVEAVNDETGNKVQEFEGQRNVKLTATLMQTNKDVLDLVKEVRGKYYQVYYLSSKNINGNAQEIVFAIGRIKPAIELNSLQKRVPIEINFLKNEATIHVKIDVNYGGYGGEVDILAGEYYTIVENSIIP
jgi:hypothetical protein